MSKSNKKKKNSSNSLKKTNLEVQEVKNNDGVVAEQEQANLDITTSNESKQNKIVEKEEKNVKEKSKEIKKNQGNKKKRQDKDGKKSLGQKSRAMFSELKKVSWPSFKEASKQTGVVLLLVVCFGLLLLGVNLLLGWLFSLIV